MNKSIFIFLFILFFLSSGCTIKNEEISVFNDKGIIEEIEPIRDGVGYFLGIDILFDIPEDYSKEEILISPNIFDGISQYENFIPGKEYIVNIEIKNKSQFNYFYKDRSFEINTKIIDDSSNYINTGAIGFDGLYIYDIYQPYRTKNDALLALFSGKSEFFSDSLIDTLLKEKGYLGFEELDKYYLDYYGEKSLYLLASRIFSGEKTKILETNMNVISLSYNYLYNSLVKLNYDGNDYYSMGEIMINSEFNDFFSKSGGNLKPNGSLVKRVSFLIDKRYDYELYKYYNIFGNCQFILLKENIS